MIACHVNPNRFILSIDFFNFMLLSHFYEPLKNKKMKNENLRKLSKTEMKNVMGGAVEDEGIGSCMVKCYSSPYPSGYLGSVSVEGCVGNNNTLVQCWTANYNANYTSCTCSSNA